MTDDEFKEHIEQEFERIMYGDGIETNFGGLISVFHKPEPAKLPNVMTRQLSRQKERLNKKGRTL